MVLHALHLCSGYGGFELALRLAGIPARRTVAHVERDAYAAAALVARMEDQTLDPAPIWSDLETFDGAAWRGRVDLITAGFPCQPFSAAGQRRGVDDERWLWPDIARIVADVGPRLVFLENVPQLVRLGLPHVVSDLAALGFDAEWGLLSASAVGAPHHRERFWLLAHAGGRQQRERDAFVAGRPSGRTGSVESPGSHVGDTGGAGRRQITGSPPRHETRDGTEHGHIVDGPSEDVDAAGSQGHPQRRPFVATGTTFPEPAGPGRAFPPPPDAIDGWRQWITEGGPEPQIRRSIDGATGRMVRPHNLPDRLHMLGNGLVPRVAAAALFELARRAGVRLT